MSAPERARRLVAGVVHDDQPQPAPRAAPWPVLADAAYHGLAAELVRTIEPHTEADPAGLLVATLALFGALVGPGPHALADSAEHPARLFVALVGATAKGRKSTIVTNVRRAMRAVDPGFFEARSVSGFGSGEALVDSIRGDDEATQDPRLLVVEPELARILDVARRDGSTLSSVLREAWDGGQLSVRSRARITVVRSNHLVVLGAITADELRRKLTESDIAAGLANRFLFVAVRRAKLLPSGGALSDNELAPFARKFALLASQARSTGVLCRTAAADELWAQLYATMAEDEPPGLLGAIIARDAAQVLRLSVTFALLDGATAIDTPHLEAAWAVWRYARASAASIFGESCSDPVADKLLVAVREAGSVGLDGRRQHAALGGHASAARLAEARALLVAKGLATLEELDSGGRPVIVLRAVAPASNPARSLASAFEGRDVS